MSGRGVIGVSSGHTAVEGTTSSGIAIYGGVDAGARGRGVVGVSGSRTAIEGNSTSGDAVYGVSKSGIGVHGKGGHLGGYFEGNVQITGDLSIQGVSIQAWLQRIITLEKLIDNLLTRLQILNEKNQTPPKKNRGASCIMDYDPEAPPSDAVVGVKVHGGGFYADKVVTVMQVARPQNGQDSQFANTKADSSGGYLVRRSVLKNFPKQPVELYAIGSMSGITSNTAGMNI
ncbi:hypothetical protein [Arthrobacter sp. UYCu712]|uniref:hypothetical protein n=1 Tax=Arthrobacter sp. UYCu712 TaxID=3156340 RepID=UPI003397087A